MRRVAPKRSAGAAAASEAPASAERDVSEGVRRAKKKRNIAEFESWGRLHTLFAAVSAPRKSPAAADANNH